MVIQISFAAVEQRESALTILFARFPVEEQSGRIAEALRAASLGKLDLTGLSVAKENGQLVGATLVLHQADGTSLCWPPMTTCQCADPTAVEAALMEHVCRDVEKSGSRIAQALLDQDDFAETELLTQFDFVHATDMFFLARELKPEDRQLVTQTAELDFDLYTPEIHNRFESAIEQSYRMSLDCPFLDGLRSGASALKGHQQSGAFDPAGWRLYRKDGKDVGILLMNEHPDQSSVELVYFGVAAAFRGHGYGRQILREGLQAAALTGHSILFLAVDCGNFYANGLYDELGFVELAKRKVLIRRSASVARE